MDEKLKFIARLLEGEKMGGIRMEFRTKPFTSRGLVRMTSGEAWDEG